MKTPKHLRWLTIGIATPICLIAVLFIAIHHSVSNANKAAKDFCYEITLGDSIDSVLAKAEQRRAHVIINETNTEAIFIFKTCVPAHASCSVDFKNGKISSKSWSQTSD